MAEKGYKNLKGVNEGVNGLKTAKEKPRNRCSYEVFVWRRHPDLNRGIRVLQTLALPLGYVAVYYMLCRPSGRITHRYEKYHMEYSVPMW